MLKYNTVVMKMKKTLFISVLIIAVLFLLTPAIPAFQFSMVNEAQEMRIKEEYNLPLDMDFQLESLKESQSLFYKSDTQLLKTSIRNIVENVITNEMSKNLDGDGDPEPQALILLGIFVYTVIFWILFKIILFVLGDIGSFFGSIYNFFKSKIVNFFTIILGFIGTILNVIGGGFVLLYNLIVKIIEAIGGGIVILINLIIKIIQAIGGGIGILFNLIVTILIALLTLGAGFVKMVINLIILILFGIVKIIGLTWNTIGNIVELFFNIMLLIFQAISPNFNGSVT